MKRMGDNYYGGCLSILLLVLVLTVSSCQTTSNEDIRPPLIDDTEFTDFKPAEANE